MIFSKKKAKVNFCPERIFDFSLMENLVGVELIQILLLHIVWIYKLKLIAKDT